MCGSASSPRSIEFEAQATGGPYQLFCVSCPMPDFPVSGGSQFDKEALEIARQKLLVDFPDKLEADVALAFILAGREPSWSGASYAYLDRLAVSGLRREHNQRMRRLMWHRISRQKITSMRRADVLAYVSGGYVDLFWSSVRQLVQKRYLSFTIYEVEGEDMPVYLPEPCFAEQICNSLSR